MQTHNFIVFQIRNRQKCIEIALVNNSARAHPIMMPDTEEKCFAINREFDVDLYIYPVRSRGVYFAYFEFNAITLNTRLFNVTYNEQNRTRALTHTQDCCLNFLLRDTFSLVSLLLARVSV